MITKKFSKEEKEIFLRMVDHFIRCEKREIHEIKNLNGDKKFIPQSEEYLKLFKSIKEKVQNCLF